MFWLSLALRTDRLGHQIATTSTDRRPWFGLQERSPSGAEWLGPICLLRTQENDAVDKALTLFRPRLGINRA